MPRSFIGAALLAAAAKPVVALLPATPTLLTWQQVVRAALALANAGALCVYRRALPPRAAKYFSLLAALQFHLPFYAGNSKIVHKNFVCYY